MQKDTKEKSLWYVIIASVTAFIIGFGLYSKTLTNEQLYTIITLSIAAALYVKSGIAALKNILGVFVIIFAISIYNVITMEITNYIIQPTTLTAASIFGFLSFTYRQNNSMQRSRTLWVTLFALSLIAIKSAILITFENFILSESIGAIFTVISIVAWNIWIVKSKKTQVNEPTFTQDSYNDYLIIDSEDLLDLDNTLWVNSKSINGVNAKPFIIDKAIEADNDSKTLIIANKGSDEHYQERYLNIRNKQTIKFIYIQYNKTNLNDIIDEIK